MCFPTGRTPGSYQKHVKEWLALGIVEPARSQYNSPMFCVGKKDGTLRLVQDFQALNSASMEDKYTMKDITDCIGEIGGAGSSIFSTLDLTSGFWQMVLQKKSRPYTALTVPISMANVTNGTVGLSGQFPTLGRTGYAQHHKSHYLY